MILESLPGFVTEQIILEDGTQVVLRSIEPSDIPSCLYLRKEVYGKPFLEAEWNWKYGDQCPYPHDVLIVENKEKIIAIQAMIVYPFKLGEEIISTLSLLDLMVHPDWQGKGLFRQIIGKIERELLGRFYFIYTFPNRRSLYGFTRKFGWTNVLKPQLLARPTIPYRVQESKHEHSNTSETGILKDKTYMRWRYSRPCREYVRLPGGGVVALLKTFGVKIGLAAEFPQHSFDEILKKVENKLSPNPLVFLVNPTRPAYRLLKRKGYVAILNHFRGFNLVAKMDPKRRTILQDLIKWNLSFGDIDVI